MKRTTQVLTALCVLLMLSVSVFADTSKAKKPASIKLMVDGTFLVKENGEDVLVAGYKKLTGIDLVLNHPIHNEYAKKVDLAFSTGDIPDVMIMSNNNYLKYATAGALYDLTKLYDNSRFKKNVANQGIIDALRLNGKLYGLPYDRGNGTITYVRGDWLEKLGMKAPTNYAEFLEMLRAFKNRNPDGIPADKVIAITSAGLVNTEYPLDIYLREFYQDATPDFVKVGTKWVDGMSQPNMVAALKRMRDAYAEGLIDKEIITNKTSTCRDKFNTGNVGVFNYWAGTWNETLAVNIAPNVPAAKVTPIPAIKETKYVERPATTLCISKACKNPQGVFEYFFERLLDSGEGQKLMTLGIEGTTFKMVDGKAEFLPGIQNPSKPFSKIWFSPELSITTYKVPYAFPERITSSLEMFRKDAVSYTLLPSSDSLNKYGKELNDIRTSYVSKIVYGTLTIEDGLAAYKKEATGYVDAVLKEVNK